MHFLTQGWREGRDPHPLFDTFWHLAQHRNVAQTGANPLIYYLVHGWRQGHDPHPLFDTSWYLAQHPNVAQTGANPLIQYVVQGWREQHAPHPLFDTAWYLAQHPDIAHAGVNPVVHFLTQGWREGRDPHPLFDTARYLAQHPDIAHAGVNPVMHFLTQGWREGRDPHPLFDTSWYLEQYPNVAQSGANPLVHYVGVGATEGRNPNPGFYSAWYLKVYPDVAQAGLNPLAHYAHWGAAERREPNTWFNTSRYLADHPGLSEAGGRALDHFLAAGYDRLLGPAVGGVSSHGVDDPALLSVLRLPWRSPSGCTVTPSRNLQILLVSHDASRTGAPLSLLAATKALSVRAGLDCWVLLMEGGSLEPEFGDHAPTLNANALVTPSRSKHQALRDLLTAFRAAAPRALAVCNTAVTSDVSAMCAEVGIPSVAWIHELPTAIDRFYGGAPAFRKIAESSRRIVVVSEFVKSALSTRYHVPLEKFQVIYSGTTADLSRSDRDSTRRAVRQEFGIPDDAFVVLGCGAVDKRKGVDLFVQVAIRLLERLPAAWFVWVGRVAEPETLTWCIHDAQRAGIAERIVFSGEREDVRPYYEAADLFLLTSREDPFPLVSLEAMGAGLPIVAFEGGGGASEIFADGHGVAIPYLDVATMADEVLALAHDPARASDMGRRARGLIERRFRWDRFADELLDLVETEADRPRALTADVSVVVPIYNSGPYLRKRLQSVFGQTVSPAEIILLDDASTDDSLAIAEEMMTASPCPITIIRSDHNSGSPFRQWQRGIEASRHSLVWIAEADDFCTATFLERVLPCFADSAVVMAYAQSAPVDASDQPQAPNYLDYTADVDERRWLSSYTVPGLAEIESALCLKNTIPNASAVVVRRTAALASVGEIRDLRFCGDWMFYVNVARRGWIAYVADTLNFHRKHDETVTSRAVRGQRWLDETLEVHCRIFESLALPPNRLAESLARVIIGDEYLKQLFDIQRPVFGDNPSIASWRDRLTECFTRAADGRAASLRLLLVLSDGTRDAVSVIRLANALARHCRVFLVNARPTSVDAEVPRLIAPEVVLLEGSLGPVPWYPLPEPDVTPSGGPALRLTVISELIRFFDIELLISNGCEADSLAFFLSEQLGRDWFIQIDGAHREALERAERGDTDQLSALTAAMRGATGICSALPGDLDRLHCLGLTLPPSRLVLPTRVFQDSLGRREPRTRETPSGQGDHEFRFLLGCRDPLDPLYQDARNAASALNALPAEERDRRHARLITLDSVERDAGAGGGGEDAARPGPAHSGAWDAALAASNMAVIACSTPTPECVAAIFDCLAHGLPVIVSDSSIMADIVQTEHGPAGLLVSGAAHATDTSGPLAHAMLAAMTQPELYTRLRDNAQALSTHAAFADAAARYCVQRLEGARSRRRPCLDSGIRRRLT